MTAKRKTPATRAALVLKEHGMPFSLHTYAYEDKGGTRTAAEALGVDEHRVIKTLVMENDRGEPFLVLMHGDRTVSTKALARALKVKAVTPCTPERANRHTGYLVGGISPFGTRKALKVYVEESILSLPNLYINAGKRGLLARLRPEDLRTILQPSPVNAAR